jgi:hypothetical protein
VRRPLRGVIILSLGLAPGPALGQEPEGTPPPEAPPAAPQLAPGAGPAQPEPPERDDAETEAVVILKDGQRYTGVLLERTAERIVLRIPPGIDTPIRMSLVDRVEKLPPLVERYRKMRAMIDDQDTERLLLLVEWLRARQKWDWAIQELDAILARQPDHAEAQKTLLLVQSQKALADRGGGPRPAPRAMPGPAPRSALAADFPLLTPRDINLIKVYEIDLKDPPRLAIPREAIQRLIEDHKHDPLMPQTQEGREALYRASPTRLLDLMFRLQARNLYDQVQVIDQPRAMRLFRDNVHRSYIQNYCATTRCHGGEQAGRLPLYNRRPNTEETVYTNFLILDRYRFPDGTPLINYQEPPESALIQLGLPREVSHHPHPLAPGGVTGADQWKPFLRGKDDLRYQQMLEWIGAMYRPRPQYPVQYSPPVPEPVIPAPGEAPVER